VGYNLRHPLNSAQGLPSKTISLLVSIAVVEPTSDWAHTVPDEMICPKAKKVACNVIFVKIHLVLGSRIERLYGTKDIMRVRRGRVRSRLIGLWQLALKPIKHLIDRNRLPLGF
jgi:hypothetical protein